MKLTLETKVRLGIATEADFKELGRDRVVEIKTDDEHSHYRGLVTRMVAAPKGYGDRLVIRGIASTEDRDHYGDVVRVRGREGGKGWLLEHYKAQGSPVLWSHGINPMGAGLTDVPIAQGLKTWRGRAVSRGESKLALIQDLEFLRAEAGPGDHFKFSEGIYLILSGAGTGSGDGMMGFSVGFIPTKFVSPTDAEEREQLGLGPYGVDFTEQILLENTVTPTPANPFASVVGGGQKAFQREFDAMLDRGRIPASLAKDLKRLAFGADAAEEAVASRLNSRATFSDDARAKLRTALVADDDSDEVFEFEQRSTEGDPDDEGAAPSEPEVTVVPEAGNESEPEQGGTSFLDPAEAKRVLEEALTTTVERAQRDTEPDAVVLRFTPKGAEMLRRGVESLDFGYTVLDTVLAAVEAKHKDLDWGASVDLRSSTNDLLSSLSEEVRECLRLLRAEQSGEPRGSQTGDADSHSELSAAGRELVKRFATALDPK